MANLPVPTEGFSAGSIGSSSFLGMAQTIQVTWKTSYNSALRKVYDFLYSCRNPLSSLLPNTHSTGYLNLSSMLAQFQPCLLDKISRSPCHWLSYFLGKRPT